LGAAKKLADDTKLLKDVSENIFSLINGGTFVISEQKVSHLEVNKHIMKKNESKVVNLEDSAKFLMAKRGSKDKHNKAS
jgi:hypothetical protein